MTDKWDILNEFIEGELSFHEEVVTKWWFKAVCRLFRQRTPNEVVLRELNTIKRFMDGLNER